MSDTQDMRPKRQRGRPRRSEEADPTGYRATSVTRRQLEMARQFTGHGSLQAIIDAAVKGYVAALAAGRPEYLTALKALDPNLIQDLGRK